MTTRSRTELDTDLARHLYRKDRNDVEEAWLRAWYADVTGGQADDVPAMLAELERLADTGGAYPRHYAPVFQPHRGDAVATWLKAHRDATGKSEECNIWYALDGILDEYREHADFGTPLDEEIRGPEWEATR